MIKKILITGRQRRSVLRYVVAVCICGAIINLLRKLLDQNYTQRIPKYLKDLKAPIELSQLMTCIHISWPADVFIKWVTPLQYTEHCSTMYLFYIISTFTCFALGVANFHLNLKMLRIIGRSWHLVATRELDLCLIYFKHFQFGFVSIKRFRIVAGCQRKWRYPNSILKNLN